MKKYLVAGLLAVTLMVGFAKKADAVQEIVCLTVPINCAYMGGGSMGYGMVCGATSQERIDAYSDLLDAVCN